LDAAVSRDGKRIAYASVKTNGDIWELEVASGHVRQVTSEASLEEYPAPAPDGRTLLVGSDRTGKMAVWTLDLEGHFLRQLTPGQSGDPHPRVAPDGRHVAYFVDGVLKVQTLGELAAVDLGVRGGPCTFSPDGAQLACAAPDARSLLR